MIVKIFDNGWDSNLPAKQFERQILDQFLSNLIINNQRVVLINSVWYTNEYHNAVMTWLRQNSVDVIVLVAMLDAAIPCPDWYQELDCKIFTVGYYSGLGAVDYWALLFDHHHKPVDNLLDLKDIDTAYMCLNRKPHWHRQRLYQNLEQFNLLDLGLVSMGGKRYLPNDHGQDDLAPNAGPGEYGIGNDLVSLGNLQNWRRCFLNVVTETVYNINQNGFVSEKIYKPIVGCRPFLVYDTDGATKWLQDRGFEPYTNDFTDITDLDLANPANLVSFLSVLTQQGTNYYCKKFVDLQEKIMYNKTQFKKYISNQHKHIQKGIQCQV
jgi:hypothetical protein